MAFFRSDGLVEQMVHLKLHGVGPTLYGLFENGRLEEWLDASPLVEVDVQVTSHEDVVLLVL